MNAVERILDKLGAYLTDGHFVYTSGRHGTVYFNKRALTIHPVETMLVCAELAKMLRYSDPEVVVGPAYGAINLAFGVTFHLASYQIDRSGESGAISLYAQKDASGAFALEHGWESLVEKKRVVVVEDVLTTGASTAQVVRMLKRHGAEVVAVGAICNRGGVTEEDLFRVTRLISLVSPPLVSMTKEECEERGPCSKGIPVNETVGHGREYMDSIRGRS